MNAFEVLIQLNATECRPQIMNILNMTKAIYKDDPQYSALSNRNDMGMLATWIGMIVGNTYPQTNQILEQYNKRNEYIDTIEQVLDGADGLFYSSNKEQIKTFALSGCMLLITQLNAN